MNKNPQQGLSTGSLRFYYPFLMMIGLMVSLALSLIQYYIKSQTMLFLIIGLVISGPLLLKYSLDAVAYKELRNIKTIGAGLIGAGLLVWAGFLILKPEGQIAGGTRYLFQTRYRRVSAEDIKISLDIKPTSYHPGEKGWIVITVENNSEHELVLDSVMFEAKKKFFDGFVVDYESADPLIIERKEKLGVSIALFFGEEQIHILPSETAEYQVEIVANLPGDYSGDYYAVLMVGLNSKAMPKKIPEVTKEIFLVIQPEK